MKTLNKQIDEPSPGERAHRKEYKYIAVPGNLIYTMYMLNYTIGHDWLEPTSREGYPSLLAMKTNKSSSACWPKRRE